MTSSSKPASTFHITLPASLNAVDQVLPKMIAFLKENLITGNIFTYNYIMREAINNAVIHGCRQDRSKTITVDIELSPETLKLRVEDEGDGFDWKAVLAKQLVSPECTHGRGLCSMAKFNFDAHYNEKGNILYLHKDLQPS